MFDMARYLSFIRFCGWLLFEEALFLLKTPRRKHFILRLFLAVAVVFAGTLLIYLLWTALKLPFSLWVFQFVLYCLVTLLAVFICFKVTGKEILFIGTGAYALQHTSRSIGSIIQYYINIENVIVQEILFNYLIYIAVGIVAFFVLIRPNYNKRLFLNKDIRQGILATVMMLTAVFLNGISGGSDAFVSNVVCKIYSIACCWLVLFMQFTVVSKNKVQQEKQEMERLFHVGKQQWELSAKTIDIINIKCHDLKHMIGKLETIENDRERKDYIKSLKEEVVIYDKIIKTGNDALDVVLMEKGLLCNNYSIIQLAI